MYSKESASSESRGPTDLMDKEKIPGADQIVIATNFLYPEYRSLVEGQTRDLKDTHGVRGDLALEFIQTAINRGIRIVASDGGSSAEFLAALEKFQYSGLTLVINDVPWRASQRRRAFKAATELRRAKVVVYTQPEKVTILDHLINITQPILEGTADIVIPSRSPNLAAQSYPDYMWQSEVRVNATYDWLMRRCGFTIPQEGIDWFFGPVVFTNKPEIAALFLEQYELIDEIRSRIGATPNPELHSGSHYFPIVHALFLGLRVVGVKIPFIYPPYQKNNELSPEVIEAFKKRRAQDASAYRLEALHFLAFLKGDPRSKIKEVPYAG